MELRAALTRVDSGGRASWPSAVIVSKSMKSLSPENNSLSCLRTAILGVQSSGCDCLRQLLLYAMPLSEP